MAKITSTAKKAMPSPKALILDILPDSYRKNHKQMANSQLKALEFFTNFINQRVYIYVRRGQHGLVKIENADHAEKLYNLQQEGYKFLSAIERAKQALDKNFDTPKQRTIHRYFEITDDSMDDGTNRAIQNGDVVAALLVSRNWQQRILAKNGEKTFVFIQKNGEVRVRAVSNYDQKKKVAVIKASNPDRLAYPNLTIGTHYIQRLYQVVKVQKNVSPISEQLKD